MKKLNLGRIVNLVESGFGLINSDETKGIAFEQAE